MAADGPGFLAGWRGLGRFWLLVLAVLGLGAAIRTLPSAATLAISPYAGNLDRLLSAARLAGHEYLLSIPMEPQGFPTNDPDDHHALMSTLPPQQNITRLRWVLSRLAGYVGV